MSGNRPAAVQAYNQAVAFVQQGEKLATPTGDPTMAYRLFCSACELDGTFFNAWAMVGDANRDNACWKAAEAAYRRATQIDPSNAKIWCNLGHSLHHLGKLEESLECTAKSLELDPTLSFAWTNLSLSQSEAGLTEESLESAKKAFELDQHEINEMALAFAYLYAKDWSNGLTHMHARYKYKLPQYLNFPYPHWAGEDLSDKILFIQSEQGIGDALSYLRFVPGVAKLAKTVFLQVHPELTRVAYEIFAGYDNVAIGPVQANLPMADYWTTPTSLPVGLGLDNDQIEHTLMPPIRYQTLAATTPWKLPGRKLHVGIAWAGSTANSIDRWRSIDLLQFLDLYQVPEIALYGLQVGERSHDIYKTGCQGLVKDLAPFIRDVSDTIAIIRDLDVVVTIESALGHICGSVGVDCFIPYAFHGGDYRIGRDESGALWYDRHRIFKQGRDATWEPVFKRIVEVLKERVGG